ncbi:alpha-isopropylmalate synthase regulatory domain-containing protein, partial [Pseudomonas aeruginosa]|uniref:alpha-isopropylmalate synthase regulatory domain-containing protein n=1 Tax=Pseudomonas aeruginosa TaxID=287 RepID=UPI0031B6ABB8
DPTIRPAEGNANGRNDGDQRHHAAASPSADKKGQVFDYDLEALAFIDKQQEEPEHFRLDYFSVQSGSNDIATAAVKLACGEEVKAEAANGNGPVDAVYQAINRITDYNV